METSISSKLEVIRGQRRANRDELGRIQNLSLDRRLLAEERRIVVEALGMAPEGVDEPYAAETGEMISWLREDGLL